jgi:hypothetical protein
MSEELSSKYIDTINKISKIYDFTRQNSFSTAVITDDRKPAMNFEIQASTNWNSKYVHISLPPPTISTVFEYLLGYKVAVLQLHHIASLEMLLVVHGVS